MEHNADSSLGHNWAEMFQCIAEVASKYDLPCDDESFDDDLDGFDPASFSGGAGDYR
jgi:hypothetical protein